jgi:cytochrome P450
VTETQFEAPPFVATMTRIDSYAEIDEVLRSKDFVQGSHRESGAFFGHTVLLLDGAEHAERRRLEAALFTKAALEHYEHQALAPVVEQQMARLSAEHRGPDGLVRADIAPMVRSMLYRIAATTTGIDDVQTPERIERFRSFVERLGESATVEWSTRSHDEVIREGLQIRDRFAEEFLRPSLRRREELIAGHRAGKLAREELPTDLITLLQLHWNEDWDENQIWREVCLFLVAGTQTTTHTLPHVIVHLTDWVADHPGDADRRTDPEFIRLAAYESLRLHQPAPTLLRIATRDVTLAGGREIASGERVALFFTPANRQTDVFGPDAGQFNLHREKIPARRPWGLTFGGGPHICIGRPLVTGLTSSVDHESGTYGIMIRILKAFYDAGIQLDPHDPPERNAASYHDSYQRFPVIFHSL